MSLKQKRLLNTSICTLFLPSNEDVEVETRHDSDGSAGLAQDSRFQNDQ